MMRFERRISIARTRGEARSEMPETFAAHLRKPLQSLGKAIESRSRRRALAQTLWRAFAYFVDRRPTHLWCFRHARRFFISVMMVKRVQLQKASSAFIRANRPAIRAPLFSGQIAFGLRLRLRSP